ncbi:fungal-specific transcription factor domain-containing protein [Aspergillus oleicola]
MKCATSERGSSSNGKCDRCVRKSLQCVFREHCRGRKPGMRRKTDSDPLARRPGFWNEPDGFQPHSLLSHQAMRGNFSIQNILSVDHGGPPVESRSSETAPLPLPPDDPIVLGLVNTQVASGLIDCFMQKMNPYISQLDPVLHSFDCLRRSPFFFTAVLATAAKAFDSALHPALHDHAETLFANAFRKGDKSTAVIQAILLLTYWKEPNDTRAWTSVGLAIRIAIDLGLHKLSPRPIHKERLSDLQRREARNTERTFLVLFVYDRSLSLQTGKPWMIERTDLIESAEDWWQDALSSPSDKLLCAFVALRLLTADAFDLLVPSESNPVSRVQHLLSILDHRIESWQSKWLRAAPHNNPNADCHAFLIRLYGAHARLQLFSIPLQKGHIRNVTEAHDFKPFWLSYQSALDMLHLVAESSSLLYLVQDSIHVMTAYAAIFLIKLLLSSKHDIVREIEPTATQAIKDAGDTFARLSAPASSSCTFQVRFLENILLEYYRIRRNGLETPRRQPSIPQEQRTPQTRHRWQYPNIADLDEHSRHLPGQADISRPSPRGMCASRTSDVPEIYYGHHVSQEQEEVDYSHRELGFLCDNGDEALWDEMFANAGFSIQEGVFFC